MSKQIKIYQTIHQRNKVLLIKPKYKAAFQHVETLFVQGNKVSTCRNALSHLYILHNSILHAYNNKCIETQIKYLNHF